MQRQVIRFNIEEANGKIGKKIRTLKEFVGVPIGTAGVVVDVQKFADNEFDVIIEWDTTNGSKRTRDRFAKNGYEQHLREQ